MTSRCVRLLAITVVVGLGSTTSISAQAVRNQDRTPDGKPNLNGIWQALNGAASNLEDHAAEPGVLAGQSVVEGKDIPYLPAALEKRKDNHAKRATADPLARCYLPGVPRMTYLGLPFQIVQTPKYIAMLSEYSHTTRIIYTDGSKHPDGDLDFWMGDSRGHWDGDTLVVDVKHLTDQTWLDKAGNFHSDEAHVVERFTRLGPNHLRYEATITDPKVFAKPWKISMPLYRRVEPDVQLLEYECVAFLEDEGATPK
jgi:hypothetical protein